MKGKRGQRPGQTASPSIAPLFIRVLSFWDIRQGHIGRVLTGDLASPLGQISKTKPGTLRGGFLRFATTWDMFFMLGFEVRMFASSMRKEAPSLLHREM